ncbi:MAG: PhnD/SsuA/transferrin family substrate-binding protein [Motiliproteus sp.]
MKLFSTSLLLLLSTCAYQLSYAEELVFGIYANEQPRAIVKKFRPILDQLERSISLELNRPVTIKMDVARTYQEGISRLIKNEVDFSRFGAASYILSKNKNKHIRLIAVERKKGELFFDGAICVQTGSPIATLSDLQGRSFAFGEQNSTIGRYLSQQMLNAAGVNESDLDHHDYLDRHDRVGIAVAEGLYEAGALNANTLKSLQAKGYQLQTISTFPVPTKPWIASSGIDPVVFRALQDALIGLPESKGLDYTTVTEEGRHFASIIKAIDSNSKFFIHDQI